MTHDIRLTKREQEILRLCHEGLYAQDIADKLFLSKKTVDFHLSNLYGKLQVSSKKQAVDRACRLGLI